MLLATILISNGYSQTCPTGIVSFWKFDDASDILFDDFVSTHNGESETSIATLASGKVGAAKYLSGTDVISVPDNAAFDFAANASFSVECWVNYSNYNFGTNQVIIGKKNSTSSGSYWFLGIENGTGNVIFEVQGANDTYKDLYSSSAPTVDVWHHIVGMRDESTNTNKLYVDGVMVSSVTYDYTGSFSSDGPITIGAFTNSSGVPDYFYKGNIDETVIYNRALTATEISDHILKNNNGIGYCEGLSPIIKSAPITTGIVNQEYKYQVVATGMPTISYSLIEAPATMTISPTGAISWTPATIDDNGYVELSVNNDLYPPADTQRFRIFLADAPSCPDGISILLKLNETAGPAYADYYNAHNAIAVVAPAATAGKIKGGQAFSASTGIDIPESSTEFNWNYTSNFSIEFWMNIPDGDPATMVAIGRHRKADDYPDLARWWVGTDGNGFATFELQDNNATPKVFTISGETDLSDGNWHHVIAVRNGSAQENRIYVDGVKVATVATNYANSFTADVPTEISVGYWKREGNNYHFTGALDEIAIFDKAITDAEASSFYNGNQPTGHCAINNYPPVITSTAVTAATEDSAYSYMFTIEDIDATDLITLSATTKPTWLNFNYTAGQKTATLTGTPTNGDVGPHSVVLTAFDGKVTKTQSFTITVANVNDAPVITSTAILTGYVGNLYAYVFTATDADANTTLTLSAVVMPEWLTFTPSNGILSGTPTQAFKGNNVVSLSVSDGTVDVEQTFTINVDGPNSLNDLSVAGISLYPVPAKDYLTVSFTTLTEDTELDVINALGSIVKKSVIPANQTNYTLDLKGIENGIYYLHIKNTSINNVGRFVVSK